MAGHDTAGYRRRRRSRIFGAPPARIFLLERDDQRLDLQRELVGMPIRPPAPVGQPVQAAVLVAGVDLVAGLAGNAELTAEAGHRLAVQQAGNESKTFFHDTTLLPGHNLSPAKGESVTHVSGMKCHPSLRKGICTPVRAAGHSRRRTCPLARFAPRHACPPASRTAVSAAHRRHRRRACRTA